MDKIVDRSFELVTSKNEICVLVCTTSLSKNCNEIVKKVEDIISVKHPLVRFYEYNLDTSFDTIEKYHVISFPTILVFKKGVLKDNFTDDYINRLDKLLNKIDKIEEERYKV